MIVQDWQEINIYFICCCCLQYILGSEQFLRISRLHESKLLRFAKVII